MRLLWLFLLASLLAFASPPLGLEAGVNLTAIRFRAVGEKPLGWGAHAGYQFRRWLGADAEGSYFPQNPSNNFGQTRIVAGPRIGWRQGSLGAHLRLRPGLVHYGGAAYAAYNRPPAPRTFPALDLSLAVELWTHPRVALRIDYGQTAIFHGDTLLGGPFGLSRPGTLFNPQGSFGVVFRLR